MHQAKLSLPEAVKQSFLSDFPGAAERPVGSRLGVPKLGRELWRGLAKFGIRGTMLVQGRMSNQGDLHTATSLEADRSVMGVAKARY